MKITHIVFFSGGIASFCAARRVVDKFGADAVRLLFTDTRIEDNDLYRFLREGADLLGAELVEIADGRTPWEVFRDVRMMGNARVDPCSKILKRELAKKWVTDNYPKPEEARLYIGLDWSEGHRLPAVRSNWEPYAVSAPMMEPPLDTRLEMFRQVRALGVGVPRLYKLGASHNNCGGFCIKAGQGQFAWLLRNFPERYKEHEDKESAFREWIGKDVTILRDRRGGDNKRLTLKAHRENIESGMQADLFEIGGCGCFA